MLENAEMILQEELMFYHWIKILQFLKFMKKTGMDIILQIILLAGKKMILGKLLPKLILLLNLKNKK